MGDSKQTDTKAGITASGKTEGGERTGRKKLQTSPPVVLSTVERRVPGLMEGMESPRTPLRNTSILDFQWDEDTGKSVRKLKADAGKSAKGSRHKEGRQKEGERLHAKLVSLVSRVDKEVRSLQRMVVDTKNTKVEIKDQTERVRGIVSQIMTAEMQRVLKALGEEGYETSKNEDNDIILCRESVDAEMQTETSLTKECGTQTGKHRPEKEGSLAEVTSLEGCDTLEKWQEIAGKRWKPDVYNKTEIKEGGGTYWLPKTSLLKW